VTVANVAPSVEITGATAGVEGTAITLGATVTDPAGANDPLTYAWSVAKGGAAYGEPGSDTGYTFTPDDNAEYIVTLTVTDGDGGSTTDTHTVTVANVAPTPEITGLPGGSSPELTPIALSVEENDPGTADTFTYSWTVTKDGVAYDSGTNRGFRFIPDGPGTFEVTVAVTDDDGGVGFDNAMITVTAVTFRVTDFTPNPSGFDVTFIRPADKSVVNLYGGLQTSGNLPDVTVAGPAGAVAGSLVWSASTNTVSWVATGGSLPGGEYTVTLSSRSDGWRDVRSGELLDGNSDGTVGDDYVAKFTVDPISHPVVSLPDFSRGPDQPVNVPASSTGLPIRISDGDGVTRVQLQLDYDWSMLHVTAVSLAGGLPGDWSLTVADLSVNGRLILDASGATPLPSGLLTVFDLTAEVPLAAEYGACEIIRISSLQLNGGAMTGIADRSVHKVAYFGDVTGNRGYSGLDAALIARNSVLLDNGFDAYPLVDPVIIGDVTGDGTLSAMDAAEVAGKAVGLPVSTIPDLPAGNSPTLAAPGIDPVVTIPTGILAGPDSTVQAVVSVVGSAGLKAFDFTVTYDTALLDLSNSDVHLTGLTGSGWNLMANVMDNQGKAIVTVYTTTGLSADSGDLLDLAFNVPTAPPSGTSALDLEGQLNEGQLEMTAIDGSIVVDADAPLVSKVLVSSSSWSQAFLDSFGGVGFAIPAGPSQLDALPWTNINRISMVFSENVNVSQGNLAVYGQTIPQYAVAAFGYDSSTRTATWTLSQSIAQGDVLQLVLSDAVVDLVGNRLDGEWTDATSTSSGNGSAGGEFQMRINVLPGDADGDGTIGMGDLGVLGALFGSTAAGVKADFNADGIVDAADYVMLKRSLGRNLPAPPAAPAPAPAVILAAATQPESLIAASPAETSTNVQTDGAAAETTLVVDDPTAVNVEPQSAGKEAPAPELTPSLELAALRSLQGRAEAGKLSAGVGRLVPQSQELPVAPGLWRTSLHFRGPIDVLRISRAGTNMVTGPFTSRLIGPPFEGTEQAGSGDAIRPIVSSALVPVAQLRVLPSALETSVLTVLDQSGLDIR
jgi:hypothetical protein